MRRREFVSFLAGAVATWPLSVRAQQTAIPVIGYFSSRSVDAEAALRTPILKELADAGFVVGQNVLVEYRFADGHHDKLQGLAADLVRQQASDSGRHRQAFRAGGESSNFNDPDRFHHRRRSRPAGVGQKSQPSRWQRHRPRYFYDPIRPKRLGLIRELLGRPGLIAFVVDSNNTSSPQQVEEMQSAAKALGQALLVSAPEPNARWTSIRSHGTTKGQCSFVRGDDFFQVVSARLIALAAQHKIPACYEWRDPVAAGGLMNYNADRDEVGRQIGN